MDIIQIFDDTGVTQGYYTLGWKDSLEFVDAIDEKFKVRYNKDAVTHGFFKVDGVKPPRKSTSDDLDATKATVLWSEVK